MEPTNHEAEFIAAHGSSFSPPGPKTFDPDEALEHDIGHRVAVGALVGFLMAGLLVFGGALWAGQSIGAAISLGLFSGFWSGSISGGAIGALTVMNRHNAELLRNDPHAPALH